VYGETRRDEGVGAGWGEDCIKACLFIGLSLTTLLLCFLLNYLLLWFWFQLDCIRRRTLFFCYIYRGALLYLGLLLFGCIIFRFLFIHDHASEYYSTSGSYQALDRFTIHSGLARHVYQSRHDIGPREIIED
jgi:hypothetical protein